MALTLRMDEQQEAEVNELKEFLEESAASKALLRAPKLIKEQHRKIEEMSIVIDKQREKLREQKQVIEGWMIFERRLRDYVKNGE